jgi:hypothetical protein
VICADAETVKTRVRINPKNNIFFMVKFFSLIIDFRDETRQAEQGLSSKKCLTS